MTTVTTRWDIQDHLQDPGEIADYLEAAFEDGDPKLIAAAIGDIARAKGMTRVAKDSGVTREALYRALSEKGDPRISTLMGVLNSLGIKLTAVTR